MRLVYTAAFAACFLFSNAVFAQNQQPAPQDKNPQIKLNFLNVCAPNESESKEISAALSKIPKKVTYSGDFEVTRGRTVGDKESAAKYVRLRRELSNDSTFNNILYSLSVDPKNITETFVFKTKDPKDLVLISIEDQVTAGAVMPAAAFDANTPATHIKLERFGKTAIALARCEDRDQSAYETLFTQATRLISQYRGTLGLQTMFKSDLAWLTAPDAPKKTPPAKSGAETKPAPKHLN